MVLISKDGLRKALSIAYNATIALKITHQQFVDEYNFNFPTLRRIREGKSGKPANDWYSLKIFVRILKKEYVRRMTEDCGDNSRQLLIALSEILFSLLDIN